ncbi:MAG: ExeM/NucH family extracellular endonuclease, partial [Chloroflexota bacterium]|nr:ExeM/NucH family extracellular endonuclease [Chloroflexota bacterium]
MRKQLATIVMLVAMLLSVVVGIKPTWAATDPVINEFVFNHTGSDTEAFIEVFGDPATDYSGFTVLEIEGDSSGAGTIDAVLPVGTTDAGGFWTDDEDAENGTVTLLLVEGFSGSAGTDLDTDNDGVLDVAPWTRIVDDVAVHDGGSSDRTYSSVVLAGGFDGNSYTPGGASRIPNGTDTDAVGDWARNDWDLAGIPGFTGTPDPGEALNTPGDVNQLVVSVADPLVNEFVFNHTGSDTEAFIEVFGDPATDYSGFTVLEIEGDSSGAGTIDAVLPVGTTDAGGFWTDDEDAENGTVTLLLVEGFSGSAGTDLDTDNDGVLDVAPWTRIVDDVAVHDGGSSDRTYSSVVLAGGFDGNSYTPGGASRIPNGTDTDAVGDWARNDWDLAGIPGFTGTPDPGEALNTPGAVNELVPEFTPIYDIQFTTDPSGDSPYVGQTVTTQGIVVAIFGNNVFIQDGTGPWNGLVLYSSNGSMAMGDLVQVEGEVSEYYGLTEIAYGDVTVLSSGNTPPAPEVLATGVVSQEQWESVLVRVENATVANDSLGYGEWLVDDGSGGVRVDDLGSYSYSPSNGDLLTFVQGPLYFSHSNFKIEPRDDDDILRSEVCGDPFTSIYDVQGSGDASPLNGSVVSVEGVVTGDFQGSDELDGFFLQDATGDGDAATSDGIFVYAPGATDVVAGEHVRVRGIVNEHNELTEVGYVELLLSCGTGDVGATPIDLPVPIDLEPYEGMLVTFPEDLTASQNYFQGRYGQVTLSSEGRLFQPTNIYYPLSPEAIALADENLRRMIVLDDGQDVSQWGDNPAPIPYIGADNTLRAGDTVAGLTGVIDYGLITTPSNPRYHYRLHPTDEPVSFTRVNERTTAPDGVGGVIKITSFNVLNYFNGDGMGGGFPTSRGADTPEEFTRQRDKIISAIIAMDADVIGLMEIENDGYGPYSAIADLVNGLNDNAGAGTYAFIDPGVAPVGTDEIAVGFIYRPVAVTPVGAAMILDSSVDPSFNSDWNRPAIAQTFERSAGGAKFTAVVNHLKSKGSPCDEIGDPDIGDGQGNCNLTRKGAAIALTNWLSTDPTGSGDDDFFIIGDLNSYAKEDPIAAIEDANYTNLVEAFGGTWAYSYIFDGQAGYLDH